MNIFRIKFLLSILAAVLMSANSSTNAFNKFYERKHSSDQTKNINIKKEHIEKSEEDYKVTCSYCPLLEERLVYVVLKQDAYKDYSNVKKLFKKLKLNAESSRILIQNFGQDYADTMTIKEYNIKKAYTHRIIFEGKNGNINGINDEIIRKLREHDQWILRAGLLCGYSRLPYGIDDRIDITLKDNSDSETKWIQLKSMGIIYDNGISRFDKDLSLERMCDVLETLKKDSTVSWVMLNSDRPPINY